MTMLATSVTLAALNDRARAVRFDERPHTDVRWDKIDPHALQDTYGDYLLS